MKRAILMALALILLVSTASGAAASGPSDVSFSESCTVQAVSGKIVKRISGTCTDTGHTFSRRTLLKLKAGDTIMIIGCSVKAGVILPCPATLYGAM